MPRRPRNASGGLAYHVLNGRVGRPSLFEKPADYAAFEKILQEAYKRSGIRIAAYGLRDSGRNPGRCFLRCISTDRTPLNLRDV